MIGAALASFLLSRLAPRLVMAGGFVMASGGMIWFTQLSSYAGYWPHIFPGEVALSVGMGLVFVPVAGTALVGTTRNDSGVASAMVNTSQQVGGSIGVALLKYDRGVNDQQLHRHSRSDFSGDGASTRLRRSIPDRCARPHRRRRSHLGTRQYQEYQPNGATTLKLRAKASPTGKSLAAATTGCRGHRTGMPIAAWSRPGCRGLLSGSRSSALRRRRS